MVSGRSDAATPERASEVLEFWFGKLEDGVVRPRGAWFQKNEEFDTEISSRFHYDYERAAAGDLDDWLQSPQGALALTILLDQFPRNLFRGSAKAFATDSRARSVARTALDRGYDDRVSLVERWFFYLPFEHSEDLEDQYLSVRLFDALGKDKESRRTYGYAVRHQEIVERFGRFPHRNAVLGRESTPEEEEFLLTPGSSF